MLCTVGGRDCLTPTRGVVNITIQTYKVKCCWQIYQTIFHSRKILGAMQHVSLNVCNKILLLFDINVDVYSYHQTAAFALPYTVGHHVILVPFIHAVY
jgi:aminopeptidase N